MFFLSLYNLVYLQPNKARSNTTDQINLDYQQKPEHLQVQFERWFTVGFHYLPMLLVCPTVKDALCWLDVLATALKHQ